MNINLGALTFIATISLLACQYQVHAKDPPVDPLIFTDIPRNECPQVCYTDKYAKSVATIQCIGRSEYCEVTKCGTGFSCTELASSKSVSIILESGGVSDGNTASIVVNRKSVFSYTSEDVPTEPQEGMNVVVLDQKTGAFKRYIQFLFDYSDPNDQFKTFISGETFGSIIIIAVKGSMGREMWLYTRWLIESLGSAQINLANSDDSFVFIGRIGAPQNSALEVLSKQFKGKARLTVQYSLSPLKTKKKKADFNLLSAGEDDGNIAGMLLNGLPLLDPLVIRPDVKFEKGMNVAAVHPKKGKITKFKAFYTGWLSSDNAAFQKFIGELPYGYLVLMVMYEDGANLLNPISKWTIEGLGSKLITNIAEYNSFAMIGRVRAEPGTAIEELKTPGDGYVNLRVPDFKLRKYNEPKKEIDIRMYSGGPDDTNEAEIIINGRSVFLSAVSGSLTKAEDGINIAIVDEATGEFKFFKNFRVDWSTDDRLSLIEFLKSLNRNGELVFAVTKGPAELPPEAIIQMQALGAVKIKDFKSKDSYAMIGIVGARQGHATEVLRPRFSGPAKLESRNYKLK